MITLTERQRAITFIDSFEKLEYKRKFEILRLFSSPEELFRGGEKIRLAYERANDYKSVTAVVEALKRPDTSEKMIRKAVAFADGVIALGDPDYPEELKNTPAPPLALYYAGNVVLLKNENKTAIVGSRKTLPSYLVLAEKVSRGLAEAGETIVTGIAVGADTAAVNGAIDSGNVISVFAGGLDCVYPRTQSNLVDAIKRNGLVITEYPSGVVPKNYTYPVRNRIIAALCRATLVVSGEADGGARYTAGYAADYGKDVLAFPYAPNVASGELCNSLIKQGANLVENPEDVFRLLKIVVKEKTAVALDGDEAVVYESIKSGVRSPDKIVEKTGLKPYEVSVALSALELKGIAARNAGEFEIIG